MAIQSVNKDISGPDWPLGLIVVATPGLPVGIMSLVDPLGVNDPATPTPSTVGAYEYTIRAQQLMFQAVRAGASNGLQINTGNIYIMRKPVQGSGSAHDNDFGACVAVLAPGQTLFIASAPINNNVYSPYRYFIDADTAGDSALVTLFIG